MTTDPGEPTNDPAAAEPATAESTAAEPTAAEPGAGEHGTEPAREGRDTEDPDDALPMRNGAGWIGFGVSGASFLASLAIGWPDAILFATLGLAFALTGLVRSSRGRADNGRYALAGVVLAVATFILGFVWSAQAEPCRQYFDDRAKWDACYSERTGIF